MIAALMTPAALWLAIAAVTVAAGAAAWRLAEPPEARPRRAHRHRRVPVLPGEEERPARGLTAWLAAGAAAGIALAVVLGAGATVRMDTTDTAPASEESSR
ncbi:hypothetical protein [Allonocardiopsis opalescens]|uniref:Uncharacterized protein n=1 Tax=Allonocardiopsis opalescens TaxID=1144618 RepID=A0A2T0PVQ1_9ACTN|nr:hypothetical protein [Allonocardiopsis opalescens]PRX95609.1 hypothetical protein CLV72_109218 [Allonocardiopsis opalescens]